MRKVIQWNYRSGMQYMRLGYTLSFIPDVIVHWDQKTLHSFHAPSACLGESQIKLHQASTHCTSGLLWLQVFKAWNHKKCCNWYKHLDIFGSMLVKLILKCVVMTFILTSFNMACFKIIIYVKFEQWMNK